MEAKQSRQRKLHMAQDDRLHHGWAGWVGWGPPFFLFATLGLPGSLGCLLLKSAARPCLQQVSETWEASARGCSAPLHACCCRFFHFGLLASYGTSLRGPGLDFSNHTRESSWNPIRQHKHLNTQSKPALPGPPTSKRPIRSVLVGAPASRPLLCTRTRARTLHHSTRTRLDSTQAPEAAGTARTKPPEF